MKMQLRPNALMQGFVLEIETDEFSSYLSDLMV